MQNINTEIQEKTGIFCVSTKVESFPMWAHYADNAKGVAIEFENLEEAFAGNSSRVLDKLRPISYYKDQRPSVTLRPSDLSELFFSKYIDWEYEQEYRVVKVLSDCEPVKCSDGKKRYYYTIKEPQKYIKRIIVGWKCSNDCIAIIKKTWPNIKVTQARVNDFGNIEIKD